MRSVMIASAVRTAIGDYQGSLAGHSPSDLSTFVAKEAISRAGICAEIVQQSEFGNVIHTTGFVAQIG